MVHRPVNRRLVVVDIEDWSGRGSRTQVDLRRRLRQAVSDGLEAVGLSARHGAAPSMQDRGDGMLIAIEPMVSLVDLTDTFLDRLTTALRQDRQLAHASARMRLRVAIHDGDVLIDGDVITGRHAVEVCRLVDAEPLRAAFVAAPEADLAVIVSDRVYQSVLTEDYGRVPPSAYQPVDVTVKSLRTRAWVHVPNADGWQRRPSATGTPASRAGGPSGGDRGNRAEAPVGPFPGAQRDAAPGRDSISGNIVIIGSRVDRSNVVGHDIGREPDPDPVDNDGLSGPPEVWLDVHDSFAKDSDDGR
ncbi:hypothetical protein [Frankia sp. Cr2]|uniref:hypothetical protein n=1 Tax=Frankia sp. Cr2 TaxID=3073932 RepID=UPI002AD25E72|nr:hypothetical protein [Frankia sp. Cr2]